MEALNLCRVNLNLRKRGRTYYQAVKLTLNKNTMNTTTTTREQAIKMVRESAKILKPLVDEIESSQPLTQDHYGRYLTILSKFADNKNKLGFYVAALRVAGANEFGVMAAYRLLN